MTTEYVPPSNEDSEIFWALLQNNTKVTQVELSDYQLSDQNGVYMDLTSIQTQTPFM